MPIGGGDKKTLKKMLVNPDPKYPAGIFKTGYAAFACIRVHVFRHLSDKNAKLNFYRDII